MKHLIKHLFHAGLNDKESRVYLAALSLGSSTVQEIAHAAHTSRSSTYAIIDTLLELGLLHSIDADGKRLFTADSPERMIDMLQMQSDQIMKRKAILEKALPELCAYEQRHETRPRVYYYEGKEGIHRLARRYEEKSDDFIEIVPIDTIRTFFDMHEFSDHRENLVKNRVKGRVIMVAKTEPTKEINNAKQRYGWDVRHLHTSALSETGHVSVKGNEVYAFSYEGVPIGVVIESAPLAQTMKRVFELAWLATEK